MPVSARRALVSLLLLLATLAVAELTSIDLQVQHLMYSADTSQWLWQKSEPIKRLLFYDGIKILLVVFALCLLVVATVGNRFTATRPYHRGARVVLLSLIIVPATVSILKATTHVACPRDLLPFGGDAEYIGIIRSIFDAQAQTAAIRCFPAGHASGGFALLSLAFLCRTQRGRRVSATFALLVGGVMGGYKMMIGDHFLSHTVVTLLLAWSLINVIVLIEELMEIRPARFDVDSSAVMGSEYFLPARKSAYQREKLPDPVFTNFL